ncbi:MAG: MATE family efflux transporter [Spirochaetaceae bacterium]
MAKIDSLFLKNIFRLMIPIALQNLIFSGLNMVDTLMIGQLGEESIAGVSLANQFFFILTLIYFGISGGSAIFTSQFWGAKKYDKIINILGVAIKLAVIVGSIFTIFGFFFPEVVLSVFTNDEEVINIGAGYLRITSLCYIVSGITFIFSGVLRSTGQVKLPLIISGISLMLNTIINYLLIFGSFGFPKLGVKGAAIATLISRIVEFSLLFLVQKINKSELLKFKLRDFYLLGELKQKFRKTVLPVVLNEGFWAVGAAFYSAIYARMGTPEVASYQIQQTITNIFLIFVFGIGNASGILIGNKIGEGDLKTTYTYGKQLIILSIFIGVITGIFVYMFAPYLVSFFNVSSLVIDTANNLVKLFAIVLVFKSINITLIVGIFRGGGDTKTAMFMDIISVWCIGIPLGILAAFIFKLPIEIVYLIITIEELSKCIYGYYRLKSKKWMHILTD